MKAIKLCFAARIAAGAAIALPCAALAQASGDAKRWGVEIKRQDTARGTPGESTKTSLKLEHYPDGEVALLRLEVPFPDEKTDFGGSPFSPRLGDVKVRVGWRAHELGSHAWSPYAELSFPTADPPSLGSGKYQVTLGVRTPTPLPWMAAMFDLDDPTFGTLVEQVFSVAGDPTRAAVNYTKLELGLSNDWKDRYALKLTLKPVIDWKQDGKTGAVLELEGATGIVAGWRLALMAGGLLWGQGVPGTYSSRIELKAYHRF